ncbi:ATP-binding protein [candidate division KSB1 bacterium]|nr:ATP-binding protein [candidate division KSB1 bacterium]
MINRTVTTKLIEWEKKDNRKPLIIRGARQVGKTTIINNFSKNFDQYIYLNLELLEDKEIFDAPLPFDDLLMSIFLIKNKQRQRQTLIFIDEIQNNPRAIQLLRYFYEKSPDIFVIAAGSLLEAAISKNINFPVGRVEYLVMRPLSFAEFLSALDENEALHALETFPCPYSAHLALRKLFVKYLLVGGMPEAVFEYCKNQDITQINPVYESLIVSYKDDVEKYAGNATQIHLIRNIMDSIFVQAGMRIKFEGFGNSPYRSRDVGEALRSLEKALLLHLVYPFTGHIPPILPDRKKAPKLFFLDSGLVNYFSGIQSEILLSQDISSLYKGRILEQVIGQEILTVSFSPLWHLNFWIRDKKQSNAEMDFIFLHQNKIIPIEVKSGAMGRLRSLFQFIDESPYALAIRLYDGPVQIEKTKTIKGKEYLLCNLPWYLAGQIDKYCERLVYIMKTTIKPRR